MKKTHGLMIGVALVPALLGTAFAAPVKLEERTAIQVRLMQTLVSGGQKKGEEIRFEVAEDVLGPNREVLVSRGTPAFGTIIRSSGRGMFGKPGKLEFTIDKTKGVDGTSVALRCTEATRGRNNAGAAILTGVLLAPIALFVHGRDVKAEQGKMYTVFVDRDTLIDPNGAGIAPVGAGSAGSTGTLYLLTLRNGDKITGSIDGLQAGVYRVTTSAGTLSIRQSEVVEMVERDAPGSPAAAGPPFGREPAAPSSFFRKMVVVHLKNGGQVSGRCEGFKDGVYRISSGPATFEFAENDIASIAEKS